MERMDACAICGKPDMPEHLVAWYVGSEPVPVHDDCWLRAHRTAAAEAAASSGTAIR
jgi:hypothetical protein